jgi:glycosyltransferase involved in cell wall biosynthesis
MREFDVGMMILDDVPAFYYGTSPNKFFDYVAGGLPVLINYPGWLADIIEKHNCGLAVPPRNPEVFADALQKLADNPTERRKMGTNARSLAEAQFDRRELAEQFADFLATQADGSHAVGKETKAGSGNP